MQGRVCLSWLLLLLEVTAHGTERPSQGPRPTASYKLSLVVPVAARFLTRPRFKLLPSKNPIERRSAYLEFLHDAVADAPDATHLRVEAVLTHVQDVLAHHLMTQQVRDLPADPSSDIVGGVFTVLQHGSLSLEHGASGRVRLALIPPFPPNDPVFLAVHPGGRLDLVQYLGAVIQTHQVLPKTKLSFRPTRDTRGPIVPESPRVEIRDEVMPIDRPGPR